MNTISSLTTTDLAQAPEDIDAGIKALQTRPGIGRWTANYLALRGWQAKDVFLPDDYLIKQRFAGMTPAGIRRYAERWQPWRSYAGGRAEQIPELGRLPGAGDLPWLLYRRKSQP
jgi:3-methyladenine DNA glycosylase/8-oxoguanine DNA glycosylase